MTLLVLTILLAILAVALLTGLLFLVPHTVEYVEETVVEAPADAVYDAVRFQADLMRWSAWPSETKSDCAVEGPDGQPGARTVFIAKGQPFGHQEVVRLDEGRLVEFTLTSKGPPHWTTLRLHLVPLSPTRTRVLLDFRNRYTRPFHVIVRILGIVRWTREMHRKDLGGLKRYVEPPHRPYTGEAAPGASRLQPPVLPLPSPSQPQPA